MCSIYKKLFEVISNCAFFFHEHLLYIRHVLGSEGVVVTKQT